jgi:hypothetical protein
MGEGVVTGPVGFGEVKAAVEVGAVAVVVGGAVVGAVEEGAVLVLELEEVLLELGVLVVVEFVVVDDVLDDVTKVEKVVNVDGVVKVLATVVETADVVETPSVGILRSISTQYE